MPELVRTILKRDKLPAEPVIPPRLRGKVYVQKDSYKYGISKVTGYEYVQYRLVEYEPPEKRRKGAYPLKGKSKREKDQKKHHKKARDSINSVGEEVQK